MKLISNPAELNIDADELLANPGTIIDVHDDVLRDLMRTPAALERRHAPMGATGSMGDQAHHRRRVCV